MSVPTLAPNSQLNIQGVHASNISSTPILTTYPVSTTSSSLGLYHFLDDATKATTHLNVSSSSVGGHLFSHASSTQAPKVVLSVNRDATTADNFIANSSVKAGDATAYSQISNKNAKVVSSSGNIENIVDSNKINMQNSLTNYYNELKIGESSDNYKTFVTGSVAYNSYVQINTPTTAPVLKITDGTNNAQLTKNDLTFNGVSLVSSVQQNTNDISGLKFDVSGVIVDISGLQTEINTINDQLPKMVVPQIVVSSPAIYADSSIAPQPSQFLATYGYNGWGYIKALPQASNAKINWYLPFPIYNGTVGQLKGLYYQIFNACVNTGDLPFLVVYTKPTGSGDYASWYHSSCAYVPDSNSPANQTCQMFMNIKDLQFTPQAVNIQNQISMSISSTNNPKGDYQDNQQILFISFQTNSGSALNNVNFVCNKIGFITDNFSTEFLLL
jgi:hypothetical protein